MVNLATVITDDLLTGVFAQIGNLIPIVLPVIVGFLAFRKGLSFVLGSIRRA